MRKLLALVLSTSIILSSVTPAAGQALAGRGAIKGLSSSAAARTVARASSVALENAVARQVVQQTFFTSSPMYARIAAGQTAGLAAQILQKPVAQRAAALHSDFVTLSLVPQAVTPAQRAQAVNAYQTQLKKADSLLKVPQTDLTQFLNAAAQHPQAPAVAAVRGVLADASALGLVGTREQAPLLLDFYQKAQGTLFEDTAALIAARGLLRMQAYNELNVLLGQTAHPQALSGVAAYTKMKGLPVEIPAQFQLQSFPAANDKLAAFLGIDYLPNRLHADPSLIATQEWMNLSVPSAPARQAGRSHTAVQPSAAPIELAAAIRPVSGFVPTASPSATPQVLRMTSAPAAPAQPAAMAPQAVSANSGVVYSGVPVFEIINAGKRLVSWLQRKVKKENASQVPYEEPDLHVSTVRPVYVETDIPQTAQIGGDLVGAGDETEVVVGADGFKLTVEGPDKVEHILHNVDLTVSSTLKNFSPEYNRLALDTNHIFELRNQTIPATRPDHFYFALSTQNGELNTLLEGTRKLNLSRPLRIKVQRTSSPKHSISLPVFDKNLQEPPVIIAEVDTSLLSGIKDPEKGHIWTYDGGIYFRSQEGEITRLENAFVRLPKAESKYWTQVLAMYPQTPFKLGVFSTKEKMIPVTYLVPSLQIGLGKTLAPVLNDMSTLGETASSGIMLGINNVLPAMMGFVHPFLKQYGEAAVFRVGASMFTAGGLIALASGLYGHVGTEVMDSWQLAGFLTSSVLIALGTNITRFVQNLLMSANRGIVPQANSFQKKETVSTTQAAPQTYNAQFFLKRGYEVLTKKSSKSLRDIVFYQRGAMFKNLGTMLFLSFPWLANMAGKAFGYDLGLDFSASYVPYSLYSLFTLRQVMKTRYKDAFPLNPTVLQNNLQDAGQAVALDINQVSPAQMSAEHPVVVQGAKKLKAAIDALAPVEARQQKTTINSLTAKHEAESTEEIKQLMLLSGRTPEQAQAVRDALQQAFDKLGHRNVKLKDVMRMAGLPASLAAMTLATMGELGLSNGLAFAMRELVGNGTAATGIVGLLLYGCMFGWRIVGNVLSQRMSGGSMYALSSMASIGGPMMMAMAGSNIGLLAGGAMIACFGVSNFFSQMYEYMVGLHPKYKREIALLINYTMPAAAIPAALLREVVKVSGVPGLDIGIAGLALAASVALTPGMLANSSMVQAGKYWGQRLVERVKQLFNRGGNVPPAAQIPAQ